MSNKPSNNEDEFFLREEAEKLHRLHAEKLKQQDSHKREADKKAHWMKCGKCGYDLTTVRWRNVDVDKCFSCGAILLDDGELEQLAGAEGGEGFFSTFAGLFKK